MYLVSKTTFSMNFHKKRNMLIAFSMISLLVLSSTGITCPGVTTDSQSIQTQSDSINSASITKLYNVKIGKVSNLFYYYYFLPVELKTIIRKVNANTSQAFAYAVSGSASIKGFDVDPSETYAYVALSANPPKVIQINASTGTTVAAKSHSGINGSGDDLKLVTIQDSSGFYTFGSSYSDGHPVV